MRPRSAKLAEEQSELAKRIARLESRASRAPDRSPRERVISFLDQFRAGEALSELSLGAWIAVCKDSELRGALRTVQAREASDARQNELATLELFYAAAQRMEREA